jgi:hypothetical protein
MFLRRSVLYTTVIDLAAHTLLPEIEVIVIWL